MIKSWLITTCAPFCGTEQYYCAFSEDDPTDKLDSWFWNEETINLWDSYSFYENYDELYEEDNEGYESYEEYIDEKLEDWRNDCSMDVYEMSEEELKDYGYNGNLPEIIYDERE